MRNVNVANRLSALPTLSAIVLAFAATLTVCEVLAERPKLVVVVTVDQLPYSYFTRFGDNLDATSRTHRFFASALPIRSFVSRILSPT